MNDIVIVIGKWGIEAYSVGGKGTVANLPWTHATTTKLNWMLLHYHPMLHLLDQNVK